MKKLLSFISLMVVVLSASACAEGQNSSANIDTATSAATDVPETTAELTVTHTIDPSETTSAAYTTSDGIVFQTTEGYTEPANPLTTSSTTKSPVISDETGMYVPGYDPGMPEAWIDIQTREIYSDTKEIKITVNCSQESTLGGRFNLERKTENGWVSEFSCNVDCLGVITPDDPFLLTLTPETLIAGNDYRISTEVNGKEIETFFVVGQRTPALKKEDISVYLSGTDWLTAGNLKNLTINYTYVGNADYAEYGFGCEYTLEKRDSTTGEWEVVPFSENAGFIELGYLIGTDSPNQSTTVYLNNDFYATPLTAGTYRIVKPVENFTYTLLFRINEKYNYEPEPAENDIRVYIEEEEMGIAITPDTNSITIAVEYIGNDDFVSYDFGRPEGLEKYENGKWREIPYADEVAWTDDALIVSPNYRKQTDSVSFSQFAEPLTTGKYRVKKTISGTKDFYAEFEVVKKAPFRTEITNDGGITTDSRLIKFDIEYTGDEKDFEYEFPLNDRSQYIQKYENGKWQTIPLNEEECYEEGSLIISPENKKISIRYNTDFLSEKLKEGKYRIIQSCSQGFNIEIEFDVKNADLFKVGFADGVQMEITTDSDWIDLEITYNGNEEEFEYEFNMASYYIEKLENDGKWTRYYFRDDIAFCDGIDLILPDQRSFTRRVELGNSYTTEITPGIYRAVICSYQGVDAVFEFVVVEAFDGHEKFDDLKITLANDTIEEKTRFKTLVVHYEYTGNDPGADFWIYNDFEVQKLDEDGRWQNYPFSKQIKFSEDVIRLDAKNTKGSETLKLNDEYFKNPLTAGKYRIVKPMCDCTNKYIEFQVTGIGTPQGSGIITLTINEITEDSFVCSLPWPYPAVYTVEITDTDLLDEYCVGDTIEVDYGNMYQQSDWDYLIVDAKIRQSNFQIQEDMDYKPVIYLYPEEKTEVSVKLDYNGELTVTYPEYGDGWNVTAMPDGTLYDENGNEYSYLFWEGKSNVRYDFSKGFCVRGEDTVEFLRWALSTLGLTPREYNEFIVFWLPFMKDNEYNIISFQYDCYTDNAVLSVTPEPDTVLRVFMAFYPSDAPVDIPEQELTTTERNGFTVVEWGGSKVNHLG